MDHSKTHEQCSHCGRGRNEWEGKGVTVGNRSFCSEPCERTSRSGKQDGPKPERATIEEENADAYGANDGQAPFDEAPVKAGGTRKE